ncbi:hypothetical protein QA644_25030 (plasmid) [Rhizobium sp. CC1099]|uniref:hypothetical protein n=1 Tax=Rhizobium sp. CC1099 TaxID=3039160 RepID=UPI0024B22EAF|nr:hypothetical protein [Rhizobium sp. CC1099]WFU91423.1 hypothetical protein QA644_25030 [Rhizobium sp. CC1099]
MVFIVTAPAAVLAVKNQVTIYLALPTTMANVFKHGPETKTAASSKPRLGLPSLDELLFAQERFRPGDFADRALLVSLVQRTETDQPFPSKEYASTVQSLRDAVNIVDLTISGLGSDKGKSVPIVFTAGDDRYDQALAQSLTTSFKRSGYAVGTTDPILNVRVRLKDIAYSTRGTGIVEARATVTTKLIWVWRDTESKAVSLPNFDSVFRVQGDRDEAIAGLYGDVAQKLLQLRPLTPQQAVTPPAN